MKTGACNKYFPKKFTDATPFDEEGYALYMRRDNGVTIQKGDVTVDNRFVVPYNKALLLKYNAHINVEWCNQARSIKYLFKYISKGHDRVRAYIDSGSSASKDVDEIDRYYNCRYISPCEAVWRIFGFEIQFRTPTVERLSFHLPDEQNIVFADDDSIEAVLNNPGVGNSMFLAWMEYNNKFKDGRRLTYAEFPTKFVWNAQRKEWSPRKRGFSIGRLYHINPGAGELYYLRLLLNQVCGATSYADLRTVNNVVHPSFKDACYALGLLDDEREYINGIIEASFWGSAHYLRTLFVMLLLSGVMCQPELVWAKTWHLLSEDILIQQRHHLRMPDLQLAEEQLKHYALAEVEMLLRRNGSSLRRYPSLPPPNASLIATGNNILIQEELRHNVSELKTEIYIHR